VAYIYMRAASFRMTSDKIAELTREVFTSELYLRAPEYAKGYVHGFHEAKRDELYHGRIRWMLWLDGHLVTSKQVDERTKAEVGLAGHTGYRSPWARIDSDRSRHVWTDEKGNLLPDHPFDLRFIGEPF
jgi:hypothetical protein